MARGTGRSYPKVRLAGLLLNACIAGCSSPPPSIAPSSLERVEVLDLTPRFLAFYDSATALRADPELRWQLWQRLYHFAAVPPTPFGDSLARRLLDSAWARYPAAVPIIRKGAAGIGVAPDEALARVVALLQCGAAVRIRLTVFVGGFEGNAFAFGARGGKDNIALPVEAGNPARSMIHELAHAVHRGGCAPFRTDYGQSLAELVVTEGLAMHVVERALPGHDTAFYTVAAPGWLAQARRRQTAILQGIKAHLIERGPAVVQQFTFGEGSTGLSREAYFAGWVLVGTMLTRLHMTLHDIAVVPPGNYPDLIDRTLIALGGPF